MNWLESKDGGFIISLYIQPGASRTELIGVHNEQIKIKIAAPPVDGAANEELLQFLKKKLKIPKRDITLVSGESSRSKRVHVAGVDRDALVRVLMASGK